MGPQLSLLVTEPLSTGPDETARGPSLLGGCAPRSSMHTFTIIGF